MSGARGASSGPLYPWLPSAGQTVYWSVFSTVSLHPSLSSRGWEPNGLPGAMLTNVRTHERTHSLTFPSWRAPGVPPRRCTALHSWSAASVQTPLELLALTFPQSPDRNSNQHSLSVRGTAHLPPFLLPAHTYTQHSRFPFSLWCRSEM